MSEGQKPQRRRRVRPQIPETPQEEPRRIVVSHEDAPDWMVSAGDVTGAASRRVGGSGIISNGTDKRKKAPTQGKEPAAVKQPKNAPAEDVQQEEAIPGPRRKTDSKVVRMEPEKPRSRAGHKKQKKLPIAKIVGLSAAGILLVAALVSGIMYFNHLLDIKRTLDQGNNVFYPNIYMNGIELKGKTLDEAAAEVTNQVNSLISNFRVTLRTQDGRQWVITGEDLKMNYDVADQLDQVWSIGHTGSSAERYEQVKAIEENPVSRYTTLRYDLTSINQILAQIKAEVDEPAINATRVDDDTKWPPYSYTDDVPGQTLDVSGLNDYISGLVERLESGTVDLVPTPVTAAVTRAELEGRIVKLATYETAIGATSHEGRFKNIQVGTEKFNHLVVHAGETVSFNKVAGKRTELNGYVEAPEIAYGEYVMGIGGGICQVSSTLYNAVVNAGIQVVTRVQHSLASNYVPKGQDATVSDGRLDFVFKNNTNADLFFETQYYKKKNYWYTQFTIYGRPDPNGYTYKMESQVREEVPLPEPTYIRDTKAQYVVYTDETYQISKGEVGYIVDVYLVTMDNRGLELGRKLWYTDNYKPRAPSYYVGVTQRDK